MYMSVLIVDDEAGLRSGLRKLLTLKGYRVLEAETGAEAREVLARSEVHLILLDLKLGQESGMELLHEIKREEPGPAVIIITGHGDIASAVECMQAGAANYIQKPIDQGLLLSVLHKERLALRDRMASTAFRKSLEHATRMPMAESQSPQMIDVERIIEKVKDSDVAVLLLGETGTGKELVARAIHYGGAYQERPFVALNCAALNENLLESELFGHEKGAFSGAIARKIGRFEMAGNGTLFLDEIGDMSPSMQAKLLRVLQERTLERVGGTRPVSVYCRLIAATNKDIVALRESGAFREDLYYRLSTVTIRLPPLRERRRDIPPLVCTFVRDAGRSHHRDVTGVSPAVMSRLTEYSWPGNIRQLKSVITNAVLLSEGAEITDIELPDGKGHGSQISDIEGGLKRTVDRHVGEIEGAIIRKALDRNSGNVSRTAAELRISRKTLYDKMKSYGIRLSP